MYSPFPGMDPFLENPIDWPGVHHRLITQIGDALAGAITPAYFARIEERVYITDPIADPGFHYVIPDVVVTGGQQFAQPQPAGGVAIAEPTLLDVVTETEIHDRYIEIRDARGNKIVTAIELLSPANKVANSRGRQALLAKKRDLVAAGANWLEIDLLRAGERMEQVAGHSDYCVLLRRIQPPYGPYAWLIDLRDELPNVAVPLREEDGDVPLELQRVLNEMYYRARYAFSVNYTQPPPLPELPPTQAAWIQRQIEAWRTGSTGS